MWSDIDWDNKGFQVQRQAQRVTGKGFILTDLKTKASKRSISFGELTAQKLKDQHGISLTIKAFAGDRWDENNLVFSSTIGTIQEPRNLLRHFKGIIQKAGLPDIRFHDLRHTAAALMFKQGAHPKVVQER
ncbi:site-specific integrase [bacterium]|nr:site-specific integrase [bacterium]